MIIEGIPSGDLECWCLLVRRETFVDLTGRKPHKYDLGRFAKKGSPYKYMVYPNALLGEEFDYKKEVLVISIDVVKKKDLK